MSPRDQHQCYTTATRALATAVRRGDRRLVDYWSGQPITSIEILPCVSSVVIRSIADPGCSLPLVRLPIEKPISILSRTVAGVSAIISGVRDPFLYNPRKLLQGQVRLFHNFCGTELLIGCARSRLFSFRTSPSILSSLFAILMCSTWSSTACSLGQLI